jgi:hypothetical protein
MSAAVTESGRYRRPKAGGGDVSGRYRKRAVVTGGRYRKRPLQAAVTGSGRYRRLTGGRYRKRAAAMVAAVT